MVTADRGSGAPGRAHLAASVRGLRGLTSATLWRIADAAGAIGFAAGLAGAVAALAGAVAALAAARPVGA